LRASSSAGQTSPRYVERSPYRLPTMHRNQLSESQYALPPTLSSLPARNKKLQNHRKQNPPITAHAGRSSCGTNDHHNRSPTSSYI